MVHSLLRLVLMHELLGCSSAAPACSPYSGPRNALQAADPAPQDRWQPDVQLYLASSLAN
jgi:hypothetical protein